MKRRGFFTTLGGLLVAPLFVPTEVKAKPLSRGAKVFEFLKTQPTQNNISWQVDKETFKSIRNFLADEFLYINTVSNPANKYAETGLIVAGHRVYSDWRTGESYLYKIEEGNFHFLGAPVKGIQREKWLIAKQRQTPYKI